MNRAIIGAVLLLGACQKQAEVTLRPGEWEQSTRVFGSGSDQEINWTVARTCLTNDEIRQPRLARFAGLSPAMECSEQLTFSGGKISGSVRCEQAKLTQTIDGHFTATDYQLNINWPQGFDFRTSARRLGECPEQPK